MTIANLNDPSVLNGATVNGNDGDKLGKIDAVYFDNDTDQPEWVAVKSGLFGSHVSLVPLNQSNWDGDTLTVPFDKQALQSAPHHDADTELTPADEDDLYHHYGLTDRASSPPPPTAGRTVATTPGSRAATPRGRPPTRP